MANNIPLFGNHFFIQDLNARFIAGEVKLIGFVEDELVFSVLMSPLVQWLLLETVEIGFEGRKVLENGSEEGLAVWVELIGVMQLE